MLGEGGTLKPNFWRAVTDNDMGAEYQKKLGAWRNPQMNLKSLVVEKKMNRLTAVYDMPGVGAELNLIYTLAADESEGGQQGTSHASVWHVDAVAL